MGETKMKLVCYISINGEDQLKTLTTVPGLTTNATFIKSKPGIGKPFLMFNSLPGTVIAAELDTGVAPIVSDDVPTNEAAITAMLADPSTYLALLTFA